MSCYITAKDPSRFRGEGARMFAEESKKIVQCQADRIREAVQEKADLTKLFWEVLSQLAQKRNEIADTAFIYDGPISAGRFLSLPLNHPKNFGCPRWSSPDEIWKTVLLGPGYYEYGKTLHSKIIKKIIQSDEKLVTKYEYENGQDRLTQACGLWEGEWRAENPAYPIQKWLIASAELDGTTLSHYICAQASPDKARFVDPLVMIVHQNPSDIVPTLEKIARLFQEAIVDPKVLQERVTLIDYLFAHAMPFKRGSAAIGEWIEQIIYRVHGFVLSYNPERNVNLEALTSSFPEFRQNYNSMVTLTNHTL